MPIHKYRDIADMPDSIWLEPGSDELQAAIRETWSFANRSCPAQFPPGLHRHRSVQSLRAQEDEWERANFERVRQRIDAARGGSPHIRKEHSG